VFLEGAGVAEVLPLLSPMVAIAALTLNRRGLAVPGPVGLTITAPRAAAGSAPGIFSP